MSEQKQIRARLWDPARQEFVYGWLGKVWDDLSCLVVSDDGVNYIKWPPRLIRTWEI